MYNADIFYADTVGCQNSGKGSDSAGFVNHIAIKRITFGDRTAGSIGNGIAIIPGIGKQRMYHGFIIFSQGLLDTGQIVNIS